MKVFILLIPLLVCSQAVEQLLGPSNHQAGEEDFHPCHEEDALRNDPITAIHQNMKTIKMVNR